MQELKPGTLLQGGKYRIQQMLGQGGFGITYRAAMRDTTTGNLGTMTVKIPVVIKEFFIKDFCMRVDGSTYVSVPTTGSKEQTLRYREKFVKEARNIASLSHPNIVQVVDVFEENGTVYYVMQYLEGGSLRTMMDQRGPLPEAEAVGYIRQVASALDYMHSERHLCHLDIKPGNIMLSEEGRAMIIDFGISKAYDKEGRETSSTPVGISPGYAPIEQGQNALQDFSPQTDIYSLGATLLALLTGQQPPEAAVVLNHGLGPQPQHVSLPVWQAICAAMRPVRAERPATIADFLDILDHGLPVSLYEPAYVATPVELTAPVVSDVPVEQVTPGMSAGPIVPNTPVEPINQTPLYEEEEESASSWTSPLKLTVIFLATALLAGVIFLFLVKFTDYDTVDDSPSEETVSEKASTVEKQYFESALGTGAYTGPVDSDGKPHGRGELVFTDKRVYRGRFVHGSLDGTDAFFQYDNGDTFRGTFRHDAFDRGRYTIKQTGEYFEGSFKNGDPDKGKWYDKNGKEM